MASLFPGTQITPTIRLVRPLRSGGMGDVWVADHQALQTRVAVKFLSPDLVEDRMSVVRFKHEASTAAQVKSPHVVQTLDHGIFTDNIPFIVMELLEGEDLTRRLERGKMAPRDVAQVVVQVARALQKAHEVGIIHRDIKPENIFLCEMGGDEIFCKLLDFGVAKVRVEATLAMNRTATGSMLGTPYYMSPEQAVNSRDIDLRADLWSLGMVAFEALTGRRAIEVDGVGAMILALHSSTLPAPSKYEPSLPPAVDAWFATACARAPEDRFPSAREMATSFVRALGEPTLQHTPIGIAFTPPPSRVSSRSVVSSSAPTAAAPPRASKSAPTVALPPTEAPPKVPSLAPPPMRPPPRAPEPAEDEAWMSQITRNAPVARVSMPSIPERSRRTPEPEEPEERPRSLIGLVILGLVVLLSVGAGLALRGKDAMRVLFPGLTSSAATVHR